MAEDPELEAVRRAITPGTTRLIKRTLCACLLIRAARHSAGPPAQVMRSCAWRRAGITLPVTAAVLVVTHWWHVLVLIIGHIGLLAPGRSSPPGACPTAPCTGTDSAAGGQQSGLVSFEGHPGRGGRQLDYDGRPWRAAVEVGIRSVAERERLQALNRGGARPDVDEASNRPLPDSLVGSGRHCYTDG